MSAEENKALALRFVKLWDEGNLDEAARLVATNYVCHIPGSEDLRGPEDLKKHGTTVHNALTDAKHIIEDIIVEGNKVVARMTIRWTHSGEFMGIAPTGKRVAFPAIDIVKIADCKIVEEWLVFDSLGMMQQLGMELKPKEVK